MFPPYSTIAYADLTFHWILPYYTFCKWSIQHSQNLTSLRFSIRFSRRSEACLPFDLDLSASYWRWMWSRLTLTLSATSTRAVISFIANKHTRAHFSVGTAQCNVSSRILLTTLSRYFQTVLIYSTKGLCTHKYIKSGLGGWAGLYQLHHIWKGPWNNSRMD